MRCGSFVVETNVHFPTDINLPLDAVRKAIETSATLCGEQNLSDWRQSAHNIRCLKRAYRRVQQLQRSKSRDEDARGARVKQIKQAHRDDLDLAAGILLRSRITRDRLHTLHHLPEAALARLDAYLAHGARRSDPIRRRVLHGERIPHEEKVFSIFQPHTEWINNGKAGLLVELGLRVAVSEDQYGFILTHRVMQKQTDDQIAVPLVEDLAKHYPALKSASTDKSFHSPENQRRLAEVIAFPVLPRKGKRSQAQRFHEHDPRFIRLRRRHSGVESAINALQVHGLDRCLDHGIDGSKRYLALAVVGREFHRLGALLLAQDAEQAPPRQRRAA